jgi:hypothetical protein
LLRIGLAEIETSDEGQGPAEHLSARWTLQTTFYWEQTFRAKAETVIEHRYQPSVGGSAQTGLGDPESMKEDWFSEYEDKYCIDRDSSPRSSGLVPTATRWRPLASSASNTS